MTITLLAFGSQGPLVSAQEAKVVVCNPVDVSTLATLRLDIDTGTGLDSCDLTVYFDHAPTSSGPWAPLAEVKQSHSVAVKKHVVLSGFDSFLRVRYLALRYVWTTVGLQLGVYGSGVAGTVS